MGDFPQNWHYFGASVRGPAHLRSGTLNQDAWRGGRLHSGAAIAVCDGLGSRPHARRGAREACRAVLSAVRQWSAVHAAPIEVLLRLIHATWSLRVHPYAEADCATTCLFAVAGSDGRLHVAQLGDGLSLVMDSKGLRTTTRAADDFVNETTGLGIARQLSEWDTFECDQSAETAVLLATDGIADDLDGTRLGEFVHFVRATYCPLAPAERWQRVAKDLRNWPTPYHRDDKTLAFLWREMGLATKSTKSTKGDPLHC